MRVSTRACASSSSLSKQLGRRAAKHHTSKRSRSSSSLKWRVLVVCHHSSLRQRKHPPRELNVINGAIQLNCDLDNAAQKQFIHQTKSSRRHIRLCRHSRTEKQKDTDGTCNDTCNWGVCVFFKQEELVFCGGENLAKPIGGCYGSDNGGVGGGEWVW
jgi:hypothetical protein